MKTNDREEAASKLKKEDYEKGLSGETVCGNPTQSTLSQRERNGELVKFLLDNPHASRRRRQRS